jgi:kynurenine formamidase
LKNGVFTRGVLLDIPRLRHVKWLEPGDAVHPGDLEAWEKETGLKIMPGDAVILYTGRWARREAEGAWNAGDPGMPGLHASCAPWFKERDISILGSDGGSDVLPSGIPGVSHPIHMLMLHAMGVHILDNCDLEELSRTAARLNRWEFLLTAAPRPVTGGTGSPLNPIATF